MLKHGSRVEGRSKHFKSKHGTIVSVAGEGRKRKFEVLWDDQTVVVLNRRALVKIVEPTIENQHITVPRGEIPDEEIHGADSEDDAGDDIDRFLQDGEDDELDNEIGPETYLEGNIAT
jgi:hypothetical protein